MLVKRFLIPTLLLALACSSSSREGGAGSISADSGRGGAVDAGMTDDALIVPEGLTVTALAGGNGVLDVIALTLRRGTSGTEVYAALRNDGDIPACDAAVAVELFDRSEQSLAAGIGGLLTQHFYRLTDGSDTIAACVGPGDMTMAAVTGLRSDIEIEEVGHVVYRCPYFALDVVPVDGLTVDQLERVTTSAGTAYTGTLVNGFDVAVDSPSVSVFPVNRVGRPLGAATSSSNVEVPPGGTWAFETNSIGARGVDYAAYPAGALAR